MIKGGFAGRIEDFIAKAEATEDLSARDAVYLLAGGDTLTRVLVSGSDASEGNSSTWVAQSFTTSNMAAKIRTIRMNIAYASQNAGWTMKLRSSLTGSDLASGSGSFGFSGGGGNEIAFDANYTCSPNTVYYVIATYENPMQGTASSTYSGGSAYKSTNSGSSWSAASTVADFRLSVDEEYASSAAGKLRKASASANDNAFNNFVGFVDEAVSAGGIGRVNPQKVLTGFTGLTAGAKYYLGNTAGSISTSPGSNSKLIGIAINSTTLIRFS